MEEDTQYIVMERFPLRLIHNHRMEGFPSQKTHIARKVEVRHLCQNQNIWKRYDTSLTSISCKIGN